MLKGFFKRHKGQKIRYKIKDLMSEIRLAFQRAWQGFDYSEVWNINTCFIERMNLMLPHLLKYHVAHPGDMTNEEWESILQNMIDEFYLADEENFIDFYQNKYSINMLKDNYDIMAYCNEYNQHKEKALDLFVKHFDALWD
jgi:hypothetical protein